MLPNHSGRFSFLVSNRFIGTLVFSTAGPPGGAITQGTDRLTDPQNTSSLSYVRRSLLPPGMWNSSPLPLGGANRAKPHKPHEGCRNAWRVAAGRRVFLGRRTVVLHTQRSVEYRGCNFNILLCNITQMYSWGGLRVFLWRVVIVDNRMMVRFGRPLQSSWEMVRGASGWVYSEGKSFG